MRLFRLSLLSAYFNYLSKNKKKALNFINLGIFLCIFAISTAGISFYVESKISEKQTELLYLHIDLHVDHMFIYTNTLDRLH